MKKFSSFLVLLLLMLASLAANAQDYLRGDVDRDGRVNISDVICLTDNLLNGVEDGDVDQDGRVNISDVICLIDYLLSGSWPDEPVTPLDGHEWVDLGLPSGTLWATCNIGANSPEDYGDYFAWGETAPKLEYNWDTYKWSYYDQETSFLCFSKYNTGDYQGTVDGKTELDPDDDAAYVNWGHQWRMPNRAQQVELREYCTWQCIQRNGVYGQLVTGPNGNTMFLPFTGEGEYSDGLHNGKGSDGDYWSRTRNLTYSNHACCQYIDYYGSFGWNIDYFLRYRGFAVRAVRVSQN